MQYSSKDFSRVSDALKVEMPRKLIHKQVINGNTQEEEQFSIERRHLVRIVDLPSKTMSMTLGGLEPGESSGKHRHTYETLIYIIEGCGKTVIESEEIHWEKGDAIYIPSWAWHQHTNLSQNTPCLYLASENAPLLQNLGQAVREEAIKIT